MEIENNTFVSLLPVPQEPTPLMIEEGVAAFLARDKRFGSAEEAVTNIYRAMLEASRSRPTRGTEDE